MRRPDRAGAAVGCSEHGVRQAGSPSAKDQVNDALDAYGFDFIQLPEADLRVKAAGGKVTVEIKRFHRGGLDPDDAAGLADKGRGDLAMVLVDAAYDGSAFRLDQHVFGEDLQAEKWSFAVERDDAADVMLVLVDVYGPVLGSVSGAAK